MKKHTLGLVGAAVFIAAPLAAPSVASADPGGGEIWKCWQTRENDVAILRTQYWSCRGGLVMRISTYDGRLIAKYDGNCANDLWRRTSHRATWADMIQWCPPDGRYRGSK